MTKVPKVAQCPHGLAAEECWKCGPDVQGPVLAELVTTPAEAILKVLEAAHEDELLYGGDPQKVDPSGWTKSTFPTVADRILAGLDGWMLVTADSLDAAWAEAEAALPEGWAMDRLQHTYYRLDGDEQWAAAASIGPMGSLGYQQMFGPTPAAALRALAAKLREVGR